MNYRTLEVELEDGRVSPVGPDALPAKAHALLTIITPLAAESRVTTRTLGEALRGLQAIGRGEYSDLSTNPRHLDDFGK